MTHNTTASSLSATASALERVMACPASEVVPHILGTTTHAERGTSIHGFILRLSCRSALLWLCPIRKPRLRKKRTARLIGDVAKWERRRRGRHDWASTLVQGKADR